MGREAGNVCRQDASLQLPGLRRLREPSPAALNEIPGCPGSGRTSPKIEGGRDERGPDPLHFSSAKLTQPQKQFPRVRQQADSNWVATAFLCTSLPPLCVRLSPFCSIRAPLEAAWYAAKITISKVGYLWVRVLWPLLTGSMTLDVFLYLSLSLSVLICKMGFHLTGCGKETSSYL